jgi:uncharacterized protein YdaU (DUF1376 family)
MRKKPDIWMPLYIGDYLADTSHLTTEQHGAYILLLMHSWKNGPLPNNEAQLRAITRLDRDAWSNAWSILQAFFEHDGNGCLIQKRLEAERTEWQAKKTKHSGKARVAANGRWHRDAPSIPSGNAPAMLARCPSPSPKDQNPVLSEDSFNPSEASRKVLDELALSGQRMWVLTTECVDKLAKAEGITPALAAEAIIARWKDYDRRTIAYKQNIQKWLETGGYISPMKPAQTETPSQYQARLEDAAMAAKQREQEAQL